MATQFSDPALGGTSGFASQYTPIQFAPLVSLTGPILGPATPTATAPAAPAVQPLRLPMMGGMAEMPDNAYMTGQAGTYPEGMPPFGARTSEQKMGDLMNLGGFFMSPISSMLNYVMTGQTPAQAMQEMFGGAQRQQGQGMFGGLRDFINNLIGQGGQPAGAPMPQGYSSEMGFSVANDAYQMALSSGADEQAAMNAANSAASLVAQGVDPITAATISAQYAVGAAGPQMPEMPGQVASPAAAPQGMPGLSRNAFDLTAPVVAAPAQTFGIGRGGQIASTPISGGESTGGYGQGGFTGGGWSPGDVAGAYSDVTGYE